jgi:putative oxidoreductase
MSQPITSTSWRPEAVTLEAVPFIPLLGRLLLTMIFLLSGVMKFVDWGSTAGYMEAKGLPLVWLLLPIAALVEIAGGLMVLAGCYARLGALLLLLFLIPTTIIFHNFWAFAGAEQQNEMQHFMKNLTIMGGLLLVMGLGAGPLSFDAWQRWKEERHVGRRPSAPGDRA